MSLRNRTVYILMGAGLAVFVLTAALVMAEKTGLLDKDLFAFVIEQRRIITDKIIVAITYMGNWQTVAIVGIAFLIIPATCKKIGLPYAVVSVASTLTYTILKNIFQRVRPPEVLHLVEEYSYSFPSGHSMNCMVIYGFLIVLIRKYCPSRMIANILTAFLTILIICIGFSRVYVGVHYPTDVIGGWSFGLAFLMLVIQVYKNFEK